MAQSLTPRRFRSALVVVGSLLAVIVFRAIVAYGGGYGPEDLGRFEQASGVDLPDFYGSHPFLLTWTRGDGQVYAALAADPFLAGQTTPILNADYRYSRVGYSWLARIVVVGQEDLIPFGLLAVNLAAVAAFALYTARLAQRDPRRLWLLANPALLVGVAGDTAEPLALALLLGCLVATRRAVVLILGAGLGIVRPDFATVTGLASHALAGYLGAGVAYCAVLFRALVMHGSHGLGFDNVTWPALGFIAGLSSLSTVERFLSISILAAAVLTFLRSWSYEGWQRLAWASTGLLAMSLSSIVTNNVVNLVRVLAPLPLLWIIGETSKSTNRKKPIPAL